MQETLAVAPFYDPPMEEFSRLYSRWASSEWGLIITGQVQVGELHVLRVWRRDLLGTCSRGIAEPNSAQTSATSRSVAM